MAQLESTNPEHLALIMQVALDLIYNKVNREKPDRVHFVLDGVGQDPLISAALLELQRVNAISPESSDSDMSAFSFMDSPYMKVTLLAASVLDRFYPSESKQHQTAKMELHLRLTAFLAFLENPGIQGLAEKRGHKRYILSPRTVIALARTPLDQVSGDFDEGRLVETILSTSVPVDVTRPIVELPSEMFN